LYISYDWVRIGRKREGYGWSIYMGKAFILNQKFASIPLDPDMNVMLVSSDKESGEAQTMHRCCSTPINIAQTEHQISFIEQRIGKIVRISIKILCLLVTAIVTLMSTVRGAYNM
jgi:hypothetical protein